MKDKIQKELEERKTQLSQIQDLHDKYISEAQELEVSILKLMGAINQLETLLQPEYNHAEDECSCEDACDNDKECSCNSEK